MLSYKIIGGDGREYGPVELDELLHWIKEGRVGQATLIWREDLASWNPASRYAEIAADLKTTPLGGVLAAGTASEDLEPVGFWLRLGAYLIDMLLLGVVFALVTLPWRAQLQEAQRVIFSPDFGMDLDQTLQTAVRFFIVWLVESLLSMTYFILMNGKLGGTVGKLIVGIRIVRLDGSPLGLGHAGTRYFFELISLLLLGGGYLLIAFREDKRALHDLLAKTRVVHLRNGRLKS